MPDVGEHLARRAPARDLETPTLLDPVVVSHVAVVHHDRPAGALGHDPLQPLVARLVGDCVAGVGRLVNAGAQPGIAHQALGMREPLDLPDLAEDHHRRELTNTRDREQEARKVTIARDGPDFLLHEFDLRIDRLDDPDQVADLGFLLPKLIEGLLGPDIAVRLALHVQVRFDTTLQQGSQTHQARPMASQVS